MFLRIFKFLLNILQPDFVLEACWTTVSVWIWNLSKIIRFGCLPINPVFFLECCAILCTQSENYTGINFFTSPLPSLAVLWRHMFVWSKTRFTYTRLFGFPPTSLSLLPFWNFLKNVCRPFRSFHLTEKIRKIA